MAVATMKESAYNSNSAGQHLALQLARPLVGLAAEKLRELVLASGLSAVCLADCGCSQVRA